MKTIQISSNSKKAPAQKAQQALEELANSGVREERLTAAWGHLILAGSRDYAEDCQEILEAYKKGQEALKDNTTKIYPSQFKR